MVGAGKVEEQHGEHPTTRYISAVKGELSWEGLGNQR